MYRMQNTVDHTNIAELAKMIGAEYIPVDGEEKKAQTCNEPATWAFGIGSYHENRPQQTQIAE